MTVLASTGLDITINLLLVVFVLVCLLMSMIILMQRPKNEGLGAAFGSGATDQLFGAQTTNVLQRGTVYLASAFFILTLTLAVLITKRNASHQSLVGQVAPPVPEAPATEEKKAEDETKPENKPLESNVATPPVEAPKPAETPAPAPAPAPAPEAEQKPAEPATPPAENKPAEPETPPAQDKQ
ncbi:preprotein translocase subunit SecG [Haloferula sp. BvORR071]|uniref:preprotein translocase subunit SecG n=1 Tax=Haloferula sp. BvORR071 TaxID=1396141 RepID=UPI0006965E33|nr:preprotein translocase subunit SecG [Haloferula sp. BvORR071]